MDVYKSFLEMEVRDYECDFQGIVNNAVYLNYLEHARHKVLREADMDFIDLAKKGINLVVIRSEIDYIRSLKYSQKFIVCSTIRKISKLRFAFDQAIFSLPEKKSILKAVIIGTSINNEGRPQYFPEVDDLLSRIANP